MDNGYIPILAGRLSGVEGRQKKPTITLQTELKQILNSLFCQNILHLLVSKIENLMIQFFLSKTRCFSSTVIIEMSIFLQLLQQPKTKNLTSLCERDI